MKRLLPIAAAVVVAATAASQLAAAPAHKPHSTASKVVTLPDGLKYQDIVVGKGAHPKTGQTVIVDYVGTLTNGTKFDASQDHGSTFSFSIGEGQVIKGWDEGVMSMRVGGERKLIVPPSLGYGPQAMGPIPPNSTLIFDVKLHGVQ